jgi:PAS domain-containing protein
MSNKVTSTKVAFTVAAVGTILVAMAALTEYLSVSSAPDGLLSARTVAQRFVTIFLLVLASFELTLFILHRFIRKQEYIINDQSEQLKRYSKRLEELVGDQYERLKRIMSQFQAITGNLPVILWAVNGRGEIKFAEGSGLSILALREQDIVGKRVEDVFGEGTTVTNHVNFALGGEQISATDHIRQAWFAARYAPIRDKSGTISGAIMVAVDVTDEFQQNRRAASAQEHARALAGYLDLPAVVLTEEGVRLMNAGAEKVLGKSEEELAHTAPNGILSSDTLKMIDRAMVPGTAKRDTEVSLLMADGSEKKTLSDLYLTEANSHREILVVIKGEPAAPVTAPKTPKMPPKAKTAGKVADKPAKEKGKLKS